MQIQTALMNSGANSVAPDAPSGTLSTAFAMLAAASDTLQPASAMLWATVAGAWLGLGIVPGWSCLRSA
jgi:hypothetical protein